MTENRITRKVCPNCLGYSWGRGPIPCAVCNGSGKVYPDKVLTLVLTALNSVDAYEWNRDLKQAVAVLDALAETE